MLPMLIDTTLREGEQRFGAYFPLETKRRLVEGLMAVGVEEIELGVVGRDGCVAGLLAHARAVAAGREGKSPALSVWSPCRLDDLDKAALLAPDRVCLGVPVSDAHIERRLGRDRSWVLRLVRDILAGARARGLGYVSLGLEDVSRADLGFALEVAEAARENGAARVRLSDTVGVLAPEELADLVRRFKEVPGLEVAVHCHNDFGMATACSLSGLAAGADYADGSLLGLGERAGIARLEELLAFLVLRRNAGYDLAPLADLCRLAAEAAGVPPHPHKAIAGSRLFHCESGLHAHGLYRDPALYEPYDPALFGHARVIAVGKKSGRAAVARKAEELGLTVTDLEGLVERVRQRSEELGRPLTDAELAGLACSCPTLSGGRSQTVGGLLARGEAKAVFPPELF